MEKPPMFTENSEEKPFDIQGYLEKPEEEKDPMALMQRLAEEGATQETYEALIPEVEKATLAKMSILETRQLLMRGDCISREALDNPKEYLERTTTALRTQAVKFQDENEKKRALLQLQNDVIVRATIAEHYAEKSENAENESAIIYSLTNPSHNVSQLELTKHGKMVKYTYGESDEVGRRYENPRVIKLPRKVLSKIEAGEDPRKPHGPFRYFGQTEQAPLSAFGISEKHHARNVVPKGRFSWNLDTRSAYLEVPESYLASMLCVEKMLSA